VRRDLHPLIVFVRRLMVAQAVMATTISLIFNRRSVPWLVFTLVLAVVVCVLASLVRSGSPGTWTAAVAVESCYVVTGVYHFIFVRYIGGTLFAIIILGTLLSPSAARAFAVEPRWRPRRRRAARAATAAADDAEPTVLANPASLADGESLHGHLAG
jgi:glucan phosphoethanolaminetransferase (alkaline phosphatase superfamily)